MLLNVTHWQRPLVLLASVIICAGLCVGCGNKTDPAAAGESLLQLAEQGDLSAVETLLADNVPVDYRNSCQWTPLMKAALTGHTDVAARLLTAGADVNAADSGNYTALLLAASNNHTATAELLLNHGAAINHQEATEGFTALIWAAKLGHQRTVELLLRRGADVTLTDQSGRTALQWAQAQQHVNVAALLSAAPSH